MAKGKNDAAPRPSAVVEEGGLRHRSQARGLLNTSNLPALQNLLKRDPHAYTDEFKQQWNHYQSLKEIYAANIGSIGADHAIAGGVVDVAAGAGQGPSAAAVVAGGQGSRMAKEQEDRFRELIAFVAQLVPSYPDIASSFPRDLSELLLKHHSSLSPDLRHAAVRSLVLLHNREVIDSEELLRTLFPLLSITTSSSLRSLIQSTILGDIKNANAKAKNHKLNRIVQGLLFGVVEQGMKGSDDIHIHSKRKDAEPKGKSQALWAVRLAADLWRKNIWNDAKTVALLALACFHPHPKVQSSAVRFFLNDLHHAEDDGEESESDSQDEPVIPDVNKLKHQRKVNKKTRSNDRKVKAAAATAKKRNKAKAARADEAQGNFAAVYLLNDPQSFGEKLFENLSKGDKRHPIEVKIRLMQLLSRVMGVHKLCVLSFYSYIVKYLAPHQVHVTLILVSLAQSVHEQTPPDVLTPIIRKIADAFVHPGVGPEVVAAGINSVREISKRQPWCMEETLLDDLIGYRKSKDKGVAAASRGLLALYREVNPGMLSRKERGKSGSMAVQAGNAPRAYGMPDVGTQGIQGLDLLEEHYAKRDENEDDEDDEAGWKDWELESDSDEDEDSDDSGGWINVDSGGESDLDIDYSDSDDEDKKNADGTEKTPKERAAIRREKRRQQRQKERRRAERRANGEPSDSSSSENESDDESAADSDAEDSDDEGQNEAAGSAGAASAASAAARAEAASLSQLATTRILTPADFAKLNELRLAAAEAAVATGGRAGAAAKREIAELQARKRSAAAEGAREDDLAFLDEYDILGPRKKAKADYEERMASIAKGREDRDKFGSKKGKKQKDKTSSTTNEQKKKGKNFGMVSKSWAVRSKKKASLRDKSKALKKHKEKQSKMKGKH